MSFAKHDVHSHFLPSFYREIIREHLPQHEVLRHEWSIERHAEFNKTLRIAKAYLSICIPPSSFLKDPNEIVRVTKAINDEGERLRSTQRDKFGYLACLPLAPGVDEECLEEIERMKCHADGFILFADQIGVIQGQVLDASESVIDSKTRSVLDALRADQAIVLFHRSPSGSSSPNRIKAHSAFSDQWASDVLASRYDVVRKMLLIETTGPEAGPRQIKWIIPHSSPAMWEVLSALAKLTLRDTGPAQVRATFARAMARTRMLHSKVRRLTVEIGGCSSASFYDTRRWNPVAMLYSTCVGCGHIGWESATRADEVLIDAMVDFYGAETGLEELRGICEINSKTLFDASKG